MSASTFLCVVWTLPVSPHQITCTCIGCPFPILPVKGKGSCYMAQYPVRWTAQSTSHFFLPRHTCSFRHQLGFSGKHSKSLTFPPLSIARYSFKQLGRQWRERKCPFFETVPKRDSYPGPPNCESGVLPLSYRAP